MRISLEWLSDYLPGPLDAAAAAEALTHGGLPVETIHRIDQDSVLDVEVTSNRGDCLSYLGIARELAALLDREWRDIESRVAESPDSAARQISVSVEAPDLCPHYTARVLRGASVGPSPDFLARRLERMGTEARAAGPISNVVDVTNYVMFEMGQPLHAFDLDKIQGATIVVRRARADEKLITIDGKERALSPDMLVIADAVRPVALAGVMGGRDTQVTEATRNVLLESARFDPLCVRRTARALAMGSESSYRFERGLDPSLPPRASLRAAELLLQTAGGALLAGAVSAGREPARSRELFLRFSKLRQVLGVELPPAKVVDALRRLRLQPRPADDRIHVVVPTDRLDLNIEADLVEEVARVIGYAAVPVREEISIRVVPPEPRQKVLHEALGILAGGGYFEAVTFSFVDDRLAADFVPALSGDLAPDPANPLLRAQHEVRKADGFLRPSLLPGLLQAVASNQRLGSIDARLYEIGSVFWNKTGGGAVERRRLAWVGSTDLHEVRGVLDTLLHKLDPGRPLLVLPDRQPGFASQACGRVQWGGQPLGFIGLTDRVVSDKLGLREALATVELDFEMLLGGARLGVQSQAPPRFPPVRRDLSLILPESTRYAQVESLVRKVKPAHLEGLEYVTTYRGKPLEKGQKSVTIALIFRSPRQTLTSEQVESAVQSVVQTARERLGATLRA